MTLQEAGGSNAEKRHGGPVRPTGSGRRQRTARRFGELEDSTEWAVAFELQNVASPIRTVKGSWQVTQVARPVTPQTRADRRERLCDRQCVDSRGTVGCSRSDAEPPSARAGPDTT
ncbi:hypothetical protein GCM10010361_26370 [Streptomyces olivaceiscleroticus]|uniref:Uncharacterized protein n=1 Tax=Streptomyces olivaceiscleroticus TaxID=68245 RepID=A0ABP3JS92_9ACTN